MLHLITGEVGSGKTRLLDEKIAEAVKRNIRTYLIVPEQSTVAAERRMAESSAMPASAPLIFEATNFTRLADTFFRAEGGLALRYADRTARTLAMWRALRELTPPDPSDGKTVGPGFLSAAPELDPPSLDRYLSVARELSAGRIDADQLADASSKIGDARLSGRLRDLSLIIAKYREILSACYADTENVLGTLADKMRRSTFFDGTAFFFDSFTGFTEQQYAVIATLVKKAEVTVTLPLPAEPEASLCYREPAATKERLLRMADGAGVKREETSLGGNRRTESEAIRHLTAHLFDTDLKAHVLKIPSDGSVRIVEADDPYDASRFVAADILKKTEEEHALYRDFAVLSGDPELYRGVLDVDLERNGIPYFFSRRTDLSTLEPLKLVTSAYRVVTGGYRRGDVISVVKCGFSGLTSGEADELELYSEIWSLSGDAFRLPAPWTMNPDGFTEKENGKRNDGTKRYSAVWLDDVNRVKEEVLIPLRKLDQASKTQSVSRHGEAIVAFLRELNVPEKLHERAELARSDGDGERAELYDRFWEVAMNALDSLVATFRDVPVTAEEFSTLFDLVCRTSDVGRIPSSSDEVVIGSADLLRAGGVRHVYLFGANEGEFPGIVRGNGYFSEADRERLAKCGIEIGSTRDIRASRELFGFLRAVSAPTVSVTIVTNGLGVDLVTQRTPSSVLSRISTLLPTGVETIKTSEIPPIFFLRSKNEARFGVGRLRDDPLFPPLARVLSADEEGKKLVDASSLPISNLNCRLSPEVAERLFPNGMTLSHSRLDKYRKCPFSYFCDSVLKLNSVERASFGANDIGSYVHAVLEAFFGDPVHLDETTGPNDIKRFVEDFSQEYLGKVGQGVEKTPRMDHLFGKLRESSELLIQHLQDELAEGDFTPAFFELELKAEGNGEEIGDLPTALRVGTEDGGAFFVNGKIDRVDTAKIGDDLYLRVVDYKTGSASSSSNKLNLGDVEEGESPQLLLYLFALLNNRNPAFEERLGVPMDRVHPAAVRYLHAVTEKVKLEVPTTPDEVRKEYEKTITQNGCVLNDEAVLEALDHSPDHRFTPELNSKKKGVKPLLTEEDFSDLQTKIENNLRADVREMRSGSLRATQGDGCKYCKMAPICRKDPGRYEEDAETDD